MEFLISRITFLPFGAERPASPEQSAGIDTPPSRLGLPDVLGNASPFVG
jgi:hypothetical protein